MSYWLDLISAVIHGALVGWCPFQEVGKKLVLEVVRHVLDLQHGPVLALELLVTDLAHLGRPFASAQRLRRG